MADKKAAAKGGAKVAAKIAAKGAAAIPVGLQLYSVRKECQTDEGRNLPNVLAAVAKMGYAGVEFAGYYGWSAADIRRMLDDNGLNCCGAHIGIETMLGDELERTVEFHRTIGNRFLIVPGLRSEYIESPAAWRRTGELFNQIARRLAPHGMRTGYHNHVVEFQPLDGELPWRIFRDATRGQVVMQFDVGNCMAGGGDPVEMLKLCGGRAATVHLKEHGGSSEAVIGEGVAPWKELLELIGTTARAEWQIIEHEREALPPLVCVDRCLKTLRRMLAEL